MQVCTRQHAVYGRWLSAFSFPNGPDDSNVCATLTSTVFPAPKPAGREHVICEFETHTEVSQLVPPTITVGGKIEEAVLALGFMPKLVPSSVIVEPDTAPFEGRIALRMAASYVNTISIVLMLPPTSIPTNCCLPTPSGALHIIDVADLHCDVAQYASATMPNGLLFERPKFAPLMVIVLPPEVGELMPSPLVTRGPS